MREHSNYVQLYIGKVLSISQKIKLIIILQTGGLITAQEGGLYHDGHKIEHGPVSCKSFPWIDSNLMILQEYFLECTLNVLNEKLNIFIYTCKIEGHIVNNSKS